MIHSGLNRENDKKVENSFDVVVVYEISKFSISVRFIISLMQRLCFKISRLENNYCIAVKRVFGRPYTASVGDSWIIFNYEKSTGEIYNVP